MQDSDIGTGGSFNAKVFLYQYLLKYWYLYTILPAIAFVISFLYLRYEVPVYQISTKLLIKTSPSSTDINEEMLFSDLGIRPASKNQENEIQILKSRTLMEAVVDSLELTTSIFLEGRVQHTELYRHAPIDIRMSEVSPPYFGQLFRLRPLDENKFLFGLEDEMEEQLFGLPFTSKYGTFEFQVRPEATFADRQLLVKILPRSGVAQSLSNSLRVSSIRGSDILIISLADPQPEKGVDIINTLIMEYNRAAIEDKNKVSKNTLDFIEDRLTYLNSELTQIEGSETAFKSDSDLPVDLDVSTSLYIGKIDQYETEIAELEAKDQMLTFYDQQLNAQGDEITFIPQNVLSNEPALEAKVSEINRMISDFEGQLEGGTDRNPVILNARKQIIDLKKSLQLELAFVRRDIGSKKDDLEDKIDLLYQKIGRVPSREIEFRKILRQQNITENLFNYLFEKQYETELSVAVATSNSRVIDAAASGGPIRSNPMSIYGMGIAGSLILVLAIVALLEVLNDKVRTEDDIKRQTNTPILGSISKKSKPGHIVVKPDSKSSIAEMFRLLRTNLHFLNPGLDQQTVLITSSTGGEGKTFITVNLGLTLAFASKKVVLLGMDLRKPKMNQYLSGKENSPGLTDFILGDKELDDVLLPFEDYPSMHYIPSGPVPPNPAELLLNSRVKDLFSELKQRYDYILVDSPPVGLVADAFLLGNYVDATLLVVRQGHTRRGMLKEVENLYQSKKLATLALINNGVKLTKGYGYSYGYQYGYYSEA